MITSELITYIETEVRRGVTNDAIQNALIGAGWKATEVGEAFRVVQDRTEKGETGTPYTPPVPIQKPEPVETTPLHPASFQAKVTEDTHFSAVTRVGMSSGHLEQFNGVTVEEKKSTKPMIAIGIFLGLLVLGIAGFFFVKSYTSNPSRYLGTIEKTITQAKSITFSGEYELQAPAALVFPDAVLTSSFGGTSARTSTAVIKSTFLGVDDWYDLRSKKSETKLNTKATVGIVNPIDFSSTIRRAGESLYIRLPEAGSLFDASASSAGANWVRYDTGDFVSPYAYGFLGNTKLYENALPRTLMPLLISATQNGTIITDGLFTKIPVSYNTAIATELFSQMVLVGDGFQKSQIFAAKYAIEGTTESPTGEFSFDSNKVLRQATISFGFKATEYKVPIHIKLTLSFDNFNTPPSINIPTQVISLDELKKQSALLTLPEGLRSFFGDVHKITSVYKGTHKDVFSGVCEDSQTLGDVSILDIATVSGNVLLAGYSGVTCRDTDTAWVYYASQNGKYYCTDSRDFSGEVTREPVGDKCN